MIVISPRNVLRILVACTVGLTIAFVSTQLLHQQISLFKLGYLTTLFNANGEQTLPAWYSSSLLLICALLLAIIGQAKRKAHAQDAWYWIILAVIFVGLSLDEAVSMHEQLNELRDFFGATGIFYFAWVIPAIGALLVFGTTFFGFWLRLPLRIRILFAIAGMIYVGGAMGFEMVAATVWEESRNQSVTYLLLAACEEFCEMIGLSVFVYTLLSYLHQYMPELRISFTAMHQSPAPEPTAIPSGITPQPQPLSAMTMTDA